MSEKLDQASSLQIQHALDKPFSPSNNSKRKELDAVISIENTEKKSKIDTVIANTKDQPTIQLSMEHPVEETIAIQEQRLKSLFMAGTERLRKALGTMKHPSTISASTTSSIQPLPPNRESAENSNPIRSESTVDPLPLKPSDIEPKLSNVRTSSVLEEIGIIAESPGRLLLQVTEDRMTMQDLQVNFYAIFYLPILNIGIHSCSSLMLYLDGKQFCDHE